MQQILIIQTAFLGDVILATPVVEKLRKFYPDAKIDFLLRKGNESLLLGHPHLRKVYVWNKQENKWGNLFSILKEIRAKEYDVVINLQRFFSSGFFTAFSKGKQKVGFDKNPLSFFYTQKYPHQIGIEKSSSHEVDRNLSLINSFTDNSTEKPRLYPSKADFEKIKTDKNYVCIAPASVWFTKQLPAAKWIELINKIDSKTSVFLLGAPNDKSLCKQIKTQSTHPKIEIKAGTLNLLQSAALMQNAVMNYVNDSAPLHLASAMNAPVTAFFCSTVPEFGFTPLSDNAIIKQTKQKLDCRPCNLHGYKACPKGHFKCANIEV